MLHFIIDGYNLLNKIPRFKTRPLRRQRESLIGFLEGFKAAISPRNQISVVFDGKSRFSFDHVPQTNVKVIFSRDEEADALIKRMVDEAGAVKSLVVVSDDRQITRYARAKGAGFEGSRQFLSRTHKKKAKPSLDDCAKLDSRRASEVNRELRGLWQKKYL